MKSPLLQLQEDNTAKLKSESFFQFVSVVSTRRLHLESEIQTKLPHLTDKGGYCGIGVQIGMPSVDVEKPNAPGPQFIIRIVNRVQSQPSINNIPDGFGGILQAEDVAVQIARTMHEFMVEGLCTLYCESILPNLDFPKLLTYDVTLRSMFQQDSLTKTVLPTLRQVNGLVSFILISADAEILYTLDGSYPEPDKPTTKIYDGAPFAVPAGTVLRWMAFGREETGSDIGEATVR